MKTKQRKKTSKARPRKARHGASAPLSAGQRLAEVYDAAIKGRNIHAALAAAQAIAKLEVNGNESDDAPDLATAREELAGLRAQLVLISGHLLPLKLSTPDMPVEEHCRAAAEFIRRNRRAVNEEEEANRGHDDSIRALGQLTEDSQ